jgi:hypothetical protein
MLGLLIVCITVKKGGLSNRSQSQEVTVLGEGCLFRVLFGACSIIILASVLFKSQSCNVLICFLIALLFLAKS